MTVMRIAAMDGPRGATKNGDEIPVGVFTGRLAGHEGLFLRTYAGIVFVNDPMITWAWDVAGGMPSAAPRINDYRPVAELDIKYGY